MSCLDILRTNKRLKVKYNKITSILGFKILLTQISAILNLFLHTEIHFEHNLSCVFGRCWQIKSFGDGDFNKSSHLAWEVEAAQVSTYDI